MIEQNFGSIGSVLKSPDVIVVALYNPEFGSILHVHSVTTFHGGRLVAEKEAVEAAYDQASRLGHAVSQLKPKVSSNGEHARHPCRIDPATGDFVHLRHPYLSVPRAAK